MFYKLRYFEHGPNEAPVDRGVLLEVPHKKRADLFMASESKRTGMNIMMEPIITSDPHIPPMGYRYQKDQIWVDGHDGGWCRLWFQHTEEDNYEK